MIKFLATVKNGRGKVVPASEDEIRPTTARLESAGAVVIGACSDVRNAERAIERYFQGWRRPGGERKTGTA